MCDSGGRSSTTAVLGMGKELVGWRRAGRSRRQASRAPSHRVRTGSWGRRRAGRSRSPASRAPSGYRQGAGGEIEPAGSSWTSRCWCNPCRSLGTTSVLRAECEPDLPCEAVTTGRQRSGAVSFFLFAYLHALHPPRS